MGLFSFLRSSKQQTPDLFERELEQLELKIQDHQQRLQLISERQRDTTASITLYSCLCWSIYSTLWYFGWSPSFPRRNKQHHAAQFAVLSNPKFTQSLQVLPIILIPIGLLLFRRLVQTWYQRKQESEKLRLRLLQKQLRDKVEELKKKTAYYSTKELLDRYEEKTKLNSLTSPHHQSHPGQMTMTPPNSEALRQRRGGPSPSPANISSSTSPIQNQSSSPAHHTAPPSAANHLQQQQQQQQQQQHQKMLNTPSPSGGRGWADRFAEVLLGDDEARPESKYALICLNCFAHNGLVRQEELDRIQYLCPKCGVFNPSRTKGGAHQKYASGEEHLSSTTHQHTSQAKRMGRQSLAGPMIRRKPSTTNDSFHVTNTRRVASHGASGPSTFSSSLSRAESSYPISPSPRSGDELHSDGPPGPPTDSISQAESFSDTDQPSEPVEPSHASHPQPDAPAPAAPANHPSHPPSGRKSKKKSGQTKP